MTGAAAATLRHHGRSDDGGHGGVDAGSGRRRRRGREHDVLGNAAFHDVILFDVLDDMGTTFQLKMADFALISFVVICVIFERNISQGMIFQKAFCFGYFASRRG